MFSEIGRVNESKVAWKLRFCTILISAKTHTANLDLKIGRINTSFLMFCIFLYLGEVHTPGVNAKTLFFFVNN